MDMILKNVRPWAGSATDLAICDGRIARDLPAGSKVIDGEGAIALPGLVDAHGHIDKTLLGMGWRPFSADTGVQSMIANERKVLSEIDGFSPARQSARAVDHMVARGTTHCRTHVDIGPDIGLANFHGVAATRDAVRDRMDMQIVAFPQTGVMTRPGTLDLLDRACADGADAIGGLDPIGIDQDPKGQLDGLFAIADRHGVEVDIHLHDRGEIGAVTIDMIHDRTKALGLKGRVAVSHAFCLGSVPGDRLEGLIGKLLDQDIAIMTHGPSGDTPFPPVRRLQDAGVRLFTGSDGIRDCWGPLNSGDMLQRAFVVAYRNGFRRDADITLTLAMATTGGAQLMGADGYGLDPGCVADLVLVDAETLAEAVVEHPTRRLVMKRGRVVAEHGRLAIEPAG